MNCGQEERCPVCGCYTKGVDCSTENGFNWYTVCNNYRCKGNKCYTILIQR